MHIVQHNSSFRWSHRSSLGTILDEEDEDDEDVLVSEEDVLVSEEDVLVSPSRGVLLEDRILAARTEDNSHNIMDLSQGRRIYVFNRMTDES